MIIPTIAPTIATGTTMKIKINSGIAKHDSSELPPLHKPKSKQVLQLKLEVNIFQNESIRARPNKVITQ